MSQTIHAPQSLIKHPFWFYVKTYPRPLFFGLLTLILTNLLDGIWPLVMKEGIDLLEKKAAMSDIQHVALTFFAIMATLAISRYSWRSLFGVFHSRAAEDLRRRLFNRLTRMGPSFYLTRQVGELMSLVTNDVQAFRQAIGPGFLVFADGTIIMIIVLPIMISLNPEWTWKSLILTPLVPLMIWKVMRLLQQQYKVRQDIFSELTGICQETIVGIRVIKGFAQEENRAHKFNEVSHRLEQASNKVALTDSFFMPAMEFGVASGGVIFFFIASPQVFAGTVSIGTFIAFHRYIQKMVWPMTALGLGLSQMQKGYAAFNRIRDFFLVDEDIKDNGVDQLENFETLEVKNLSFKYPNTNVYALENINFKIHKSDCLGIIGPVGAGKSTLLSLLTRLYEPTGGEILINDKPIQSYTIESLRRQFVMIPQEAFLFSESIAENIAFGALDFPGNEAVRTTADLVNIDSEIESLPQSYNSQLGERGVNLSGGQKQRLTIARGLILNSPVLILDDTLSAVDTRTEKKIESSLSQKSDQKQTRIIVAHRLSSLEGANQFLVLKNGSQECFTNKENISRESLTYQAMLKIQSESSHESE